MVRVGPPLSTRWPVRILAAGGLTMSEPCAGGPNPVQSSVVPIRLWPPDRNWLIEDAQSGPAAAPEVFLATSEFSTVKLTAAGSTQIPPPKPMAFASESDRL